MSKNLLNSSWVKMQSQEQIVSTTSHPMMTRRLSTRKCLNWRKKLGFLSDHLRDFNWIIKSQKRRKRKRSKHISQSIIQRKRHSYSRALVQPGEDQVIQLVIARRIDQSLSTPSQPRSHKRSRKKLSSTWTQFFLTLVCSMQLIARRTSTCWSIMLMSPVSSWAFFCTAYGSLDLFLGLSVYSLAYTWVPSWSCRSVSYSSSSLSNKSSSTTFFPLSFSG